MSHDRISQAFGYIQFHSEGEVAAMKSRCGRMIIHSEKSEDDFYSMNGTASTARGTSFETPSKKARLIHFSRRLLHWWFILDESKALYPE